jgi:nucleotide-binding universal stress UspA family protein
VPVVRNAESEEALVAAARLAADQRATIAAVHVLEVPLELPLDAALPEREERADDLLEGTRAFVEAYGVRVVTRLVRARRAGPAIVEEAEARQAELIVIGAKRRFARGRTPIFGRTVDYILKESPCRVLLAATRKAA